jgi:DNA (cytosine-5)-methyltransferase 1
MRILNLYAGIGGNRALWPTDIEVVAIENDPEIAEAYQALWPSDTTVIGVAHAYLLEHLLDGWDLIWTSPPCQSHSKLNQFEFGQKRFRYPSLDQLYGEIILLRHQAPKNVDWLVENVIPYYSPLIPPTAQLGRHYAWTNLSLPYVPRSDGVFLRGTTAADFEKYDGLTLPNCANKWSSERRRQVMRNCVPPEMGRIVFNAMAHVSEAPATLF